MLKLAFTTIQLYIIIWIYSANNIKRNSDAKKKLNWGESQKFVILILKHIKVKPVKIKPNRARKNIHFHADFRLSRYIVYCNCNVFLSTGPGNYPFKTRFHYQLEHRFCFYSFYYIFQEIELILHKLWLYS